MERKSYVCGENGSHIHTHSSPFKYCIRGHAVEKHGKINIKNKDDKNAPILDITFHEVYNIAVCECKRYAK